MNKNELLYSIHTSQFCSVFVYFWYHGTQILQNYCSLMTNGGGWFTTCDVIYVCSLNISLCTSYVLWMARLSYPLFDLSLNNDGWNCPRFFSRSPIYSKGGMTWKMFLKTIQSFIPCIESAKIKQNSVNRWKYRMLRKLIFTKNNCKAK